MEPARLRHPPPDRRRHHLAHSHTAVKIEPAYHRGSTTYVLDASPRRGRGPQASSRLPKKTGCRRRTRDEYIRIREQFARGREAKARTPLATARANPYKIDWAGYTPPKPSFIGTRTFAPYNLEELAKYIDWSPYFASWELVGRYPQILTDDVVGEAATGLFQGHPAHSRAHPEGEAVRGAGRGRVLARQFRRRRHRGLCGRDPHHRTHPPCTPSASRWERARASRTPPSPTLSPLSARPTTSAGSPSPPGNGERGLRRRPSQGRRRLLRHHRRRLGRPPGRSLRRADARAGAARVLGAMRPTNTSPSRTPSARNTSASAPAAGYPCQPDHTGKGRTVPHPGRARTDRHGPHRKLRHDAGRSSVGPLFLTSEVALFWRRQDRPGSGGGTTPAARAGTWRWRNAGSLRSSTTIPAAWREGRRHRLFHPPAKRGRGTTEWWRGSLGIGA